MKKLLISAVVAVMIVSAATAQITVGAKGIFGIGVGTSLNIPSYEEVKTEPLIGGGVGVYVRYNLPFFSVLGFQTELDFLANNGVKAEIPEMSPVKYSFMSLELPILLTIDFNIGPVTMTVLGGPYISFRLGDAKLTVEGQEPRSVSTGDSNCLGLAFGMGVGVPVGPGSIVGDVRYLMDMAATSNSDLWDGFLFRRTLNISLGYQMTF